MSLNAASGPLRVLRGHFSWMDCENNRVVVFAFQFCGHVLNCRVSGMVLPTARGETYTYAEHLVQGALRGRVGSKPEAGQHSAVPT